MLLPAGYSDVESIVDTVTVGRTGEDTVEHRRHTYHTEDCDKCIR